ncbi:hypothetical protein GRI89_04980 [Altererythrobacter salegens]|uniref:Uncharacterized protein n=1 Tax=Croceibacterium salegens TaxID=1737568 RepID=A0A6I4SSN5_9SPHN|nr:hypothetical protein [Croceibacterium salegens]MXO58893.1 hypothetical protein [Croceibacterium salegens]
MPVRRRFSKRKGDPETLAKVWAECLETGHDHFGELCELTGLVEPVNAGLPGSPERAEAERLWRAAARAAWERYGHRVLASRDPALGPAWAAVEFGPP